jgi:hypothetical protein
MKFLRHVHVKILAKKMAWSHASCTILPQVEVHNVIRPDRYHIKLQEQRAISTKTELTNYGSLPCVYLVSFPFLTFPFLRCPFLRPCRCNCKFWLHVINLKLVSCTLKLLSYQWLRCRASARELSSRTSASAFHFYGGQRIQHRLHGEHAALLSTCIRQPKSHNCM